MTVELSAARQRLYERTLADSSKSRFHAKERALLAAIEAELEGR